MQSQEHSYNTSENTSPGERQINTDQREQARQQEYTYRSYEEGYTGLNERNIWREGEKLRAEPKRERSMGGLLALIVLLCAVFIAGSLFGAILSWLSWLIVVVLIVVGLGALATNWRIVVIPMPTRTFQIMEHARLVINNGGGKVLIRRGESSVITVSATKRASGIGIDPEKMQVMYDQRGDTVNIATNVSWNFFQFGLRSVQFEITVPETCDVDLENGWGGVIVQETSGDIRLRTGSGGIEARNLQGQIAIKTGSGGVKASDLQGQVLVHTGSGGIASGGLQGQVSLTTGSGGIRVDRSMLAGSSRFSTGSGGIVYDGAIDLRGNIEMKTGSGGIVLRLPDSTAFSLDAKTGSGGVANEFGGNEVGSGPRARIRLRTGSGGIHISRGGMF